MLTTIGIIYVRATYRVLDNGMIVARQLTFPVLAIA